MYVIEETVEQLQAGEVTSQALVEVCLGAIEDKAGEGERAFRRVYRSEALAQARAVDGLRKAGAHLPPFAGVPVSIKDLFDVQGEPTPAGSKVLQNAAPASADAPVVARLRAAGFILVGRTNMTEFAYSGVGLNPHFGTPRNPYDRAAARLPGGSSSGAAISVTDAMAAGAIGTDTGGSCRIPAALTGIVGYKPTARRVPLQGALPLSPSLDSVGPLAATVTSCELLDGVISGGGGARLAAPPPSNIRLAAAQSLVLDGMDDAVAEVFGDALDTLSSHGVGVTDVALKEFLDLPAINAKGGLAAAEAWAFHQDMLTEREAEYDPRVAARIKAGGTQSAADYLRVMAARSAMQASVNPTFDHYDAIVMPTVPLIAPPIAALAQDEDYFRINGLMLRNPSIANFLDLCAISLPCHAAGDAPVGLMLVGPANGDQHLFALARAVARLLQ